MHEERDRDGRRAEGPTRLRSISFLLEALRLGWVDPWLALATGLRPVPVHRKLTQAWAERLVRRYDVRFEERPGGAPRLTGRRGLLLCPHRSMADFFVHKYLAGGEAATLSRMIVAGLFPPIWFCTRFDRSTWFFVRGRAKQPQRFYAWLDRQFERCPLPLLIVYPEGHRHQRRRPLRLHRGMIRYAFERKLPAQVLMTANTEHVMDERRRRFARGVRVPYKFYPPVDPAEEPELESFYERVSTTFARGFAEVVAPASTSR